MRKVFLYSLLLVAGLIFSQLLPGVGRLPVKLLTMFCLSFIMIRVGYGFELSKEQSQTYLWDHMVALTTTIFPWLFSAAYLVFAMAPEELWRSRDLWWEALLTGRFAAPTSVGILFSMLAAAGLSATWLYKKARTLAIFDDLDTLLLLIPLKFMLVSMSVGLTLLIFLLLGASWAAWKYLYVAQRPVKLPTGWPWVMLYAATITTVSEAVNIGSQVIDENVPVHLEVLLPAFILGCLLARAAQPDRRADDTRSGQGQGLESPREQWITTLVSACFMALVGMSMPPITGLPLAVTHADTFMPRFEGVPPEVLARLQQFPGWGAIAVHVLVITALSNLGKMFPAFCYRREASRREALALSIGMCPRGEVGAGVLVVSLSYGISGPTLTVAVLSLALNLFCSGLFILAVKKLLVPKA
jgi:Kef-type K+ transport system membrane component KefB